MNRRKRILAFRITTAILICVIFVLSFILIDSIAGIISLPKDSVGRASNKPGDEDIMLPEDAGELNKDNTDKPSDNTGEEKTPVSIKNNDIAKLKNQIEALTDNKGDWSVYIKDLKSGEELSINNKQMVAASVIKLFIMAKVYEDLQEGKLENSEVLKSMLKRMITISNNDSSNKLVELLGQGSHEAGMASINDYTKKLNYLGTLKQRRFYDSGPPAGAKENYTSVEDCGRLLEKIYNKKCVSTEYDTEMLNLLLAQERNSKLPALLPSNVRVAHKTGELFKTEHDVGIVFGSKTDYVICVMSNGLNSSEQGRTILAEISKAAYEYFEGMD